MHEANWLCVPSYFRYSLNFLVPFSFHFYNSIFSFLISMYIRFTRRRSQIAITWSSIERVHHAVRFNVDLTLKLNYRWITESLWIVIAHLDDMNYSLLFVPATISLIALQTPRYTFSRNIEICIVIQQRWRGNIFIARSLCTFHRA